jgi:hypothetical protein
MLAIQTAAAEMARVPVAIDVLDWAGFSPVERELLASAYEEQRMALACMSALEPQTAVAAYAHTDMRALVQRELRQMATEMLNQSR